MKKYTITFTSKQLKAVQEACEYYSRFLSGQVEIPHSILHKLCELEKKDKHFKGVPLLNHARDTVKHLKVKLFPEITINESYGIGGKIAYDKHSTEIRDVLYDVYRPILEQFAKEEKKKNPNKPSSVYDHSGQSYSKEGRIKISVED